MIRARPVTFAGGLLLEETLRKSKKKGRKRKKLCRGGKRKERGERERGIPERDKGEKKVEVMIKS